MAVVSGRTKCLGSATCAPPPIADALYAPSCPLMPRSTTSSTLSGIWPPGERCGTFEVRHIGSGDGDNSGLTSIAGNDADLCPVNLTRPWRPIPRHGDRLSGPDHTVEHADGDGDLSSLGWQGPGTKLGADQMLVSAHGGLGVVAAPIPGRPLPSNAAALGHEPNVAITRALGVRIVRAQSRRGTGRNDHVRR